MTIANVTKTYTFVDGTKAEAAKVNTDFDLLYAKVNELVDAQTTVVTEGALINSATAKTAPVDADYFGLMDSEDSNKLKKLSWAYVKSSLKTYFDTLYAAISHTHTPAAGTVLKVQHFTDAGSTTTSTSRVNMQGGAFSFTPTSASSILILQFAFDGAIAALSGSNQYAKFDISEGATKRSNEYQLAAPSGAGNTGANAPCFLQVSLANSGTSARTFSMYCYTTSASSVASCALITATITEVKA